MRGLAWLGLLLALVSCRKPTSGTPGAAETVPLAPSVMPPPPVFGAPDPIDAEPPPPAVPAMSDDDYFKKYLPLMRAVATKAAPKCKKRGKKQIMGPSPAAGGPLDTPDVLDVETWCFSGGSGVGFEYIHAPGPPERTMGGKRIVERADGKDGSAALKEFDRGVRLVYDLQIGKPNFVRVIVDLGQADEGSPL